MPELFRLEVESQVELLTAGLLALERDPGAAEELESCMRAAHSLKGAARIIGLSAGVDVAHAMEDCFVAAQEGALRLDPARIDTMLAGVDLLGRIAATPEGEPDRWTGDGAAEIEAFLAALAAMAEGAPPAPAPPDDIPPSAPAPPPPAAVAEEPPPPRDRALRVSAQDLNRLLGLASESLVESRWLTPFSESLLRLKRAQREAGRMLDELRGALVGHGLDSRGEALLATLQLQLANSRHDLAERLAELEVFDSRTTDLARRMYEEVLACRMQNFADGAGGFPKMMRNLARTLGKQVRLDIVGTATQVDRDILERLETALGHLLRNAIDHGIEAPDIRRAAGKPEEGTIRLEARHAAGLLQIVVADDGAGIDPEWLRSAVVQRGLADAEIAARFTEAELLEFLFLPGFSAKQQVSDISGRGVGLDAVQTMVRQVRGTIRITSEPGAGTSFLLQLPLTLSVVRALLVEIGGEAYAFPLAHIHRSVRLDRADVELIEGRPHFRLDGKPALLVGGAQILGGTAAPEGDALAVVVLGDANGSYGVVVDRFLDERELVVQPLDPRLGKVNDIAAAALMKDGSPALIVDVTDMLRSVEKLATGGGLGKLQRGSAAAVQARKRVLVVDDSLTVRELERKLLDHHGYAVETAVDGMDGWNAARTGQFDLVITDVDMPRMDGIELVKLIRKDPRLSALPVMIVSYKDREDDRRRGLEAGADHYLAKGSFHDEALVQVVADLIGEAMG